jgi:hypothetical protein
LGEKKGFIFIVISSGNNVDIIHHWCGLSWHLVA